MFIKFISISIVCLLVALALALVAGGPKTPPEMPSINDPFRSSAFSDLAPIQTFKARDGSSLAFRHYAPTSQSNRGSVVLVHGSSASSASMHVMAKAMAADGYDTFALDMRGHGQSGAKGMISYIGQLEDDVADFVQALQPPAPRVLAGFSSGGGFVLRFAAGAQQHLFKSYLLQSPFLGQDSPTYRPDSGGWVKVGVPRLIALSILNSVGIQAFNHLPVSRFALNEQAKAFLTPAYAYNLALNFRPHADVGADIQSVQRPVVVVAGTDDEAFLTTQLPSFFKQNGKDWPVDLLPGITHISLIVDPRAVASSVAAVNTLSKP